MTAVLRRACADPGEARRLAAAVAADNPAHVSATVEDATLVLRVAAAAPASVRATLDDLLSGVAAAEGASSAAGGRRARSRDAAPL